MQCRLTTPMLYCTLYISIQDFRFATHPFVRGAQDGIARNVEGYCCGHGEVRSPNQP